MCPCSTSSFFEVLEIRGSLTITQSLGVYSRVFGLLVVIPSIGVETRLRLENIYMLLGVFPSLARFLVWFSGMEER